MLWLASLRLVTAERAHALRGCACCVDPEFSFFAEALQKARCSHRPHLSHQQSLTLARTQAQLADRLARGSNWTVFAPSDLAFAATLDALGLSKASLLASKELLSALVRLHIAPGRVPSGALRPGASVESLEGSRLRVLRAPSAASGVSIAGADVLRADIAADNGLIHGASAQRLRPRCGACGW